MDSRQCPFCGSTVAADALSCYHCRESLPEQAAGRVHNPAAGYAEIRKGFLYMLMAGALHYVLGYVTEQNFPFELPTLLTDYLTPTVFLGGAGMSLYGLILKMRG